MKIIKALANVKTIIPLIAVSIGLAFFTVKSLIDNNLIKGDFIIISVMVFLGIIIILGFLIALRITISRNNSVINKGNKNTITQSKSGQNSVDNIGDDNFINQL